MKIHLIETRQHQYIFLTKPSSVVLKEYCTEARQHQCQTISRFQGEFTNKFTGDYANTCHCGKSSYLSLIHLNLT